MRKIFVKNSIISSIIALSALFNIGAVEAKSVVPGGEIIAVKLDLDGLLVTAVEEKTPADISGLKTSDFITNFKTSSEFLHSIKKGGEIKIIRDNKEKTIKISAFFGNFGASFKESITGIGTLTYYDIANKQIYAIGHKITDLQTNLDLPWKNGIVKNSKVLSVEPAKSNAPAMLKGAFSASAATIGRIISNTDKGITAESALPPNAKTAIETGTPTKGTATILATIDGTAPEEYAIEIERIIAEERDKNISVKITDANLIEKTNGIAQGMSGAPILQNGKLVGVITHVSAGSTIHGYGRTISSE